MCGVWRASAAQKASPAAATMSGAKADDLMAKGRKKRDGFSFFGGGTTKFEDASEMFQQAGNFYKQAKMWKEAAEAYKEAADSQTRAGSQHEAATLLYSSASAYKQAGDAQQAADLLERVVAAYEDMGRFQMAAKHKKEQAEIYERYLPPPPFTDAADRLLGLTQPRRAPCIGSSSLAQRRGQPRKGHRGVREGGGHVHRREPEERRERVPGQGGAVPCAQRELFAGARASRSEEDGRLSRCTRALMRALHPGRAALFAGGGALPRRSSCTPSWAAARSTTRSRAGPLRSTSSRRACAISATRTLRARARHWTTLTRGTRRLAAPARPSF